MTGDTAQARETTHPPRGTTLMLLRVTAGLSVLVLAFQFVTAGQILSDNQAAHALHGNGAILLHVVFGLTMVAAAAHWWAHRAPMWPMVLAVVMFVLSFVQARLGDNGILWAHVPGAIVLTVGVLGCCLGLQSRRTQSRRTPPLTAHPSDVRHGNLIIGESCISSCSSVSVVAGRR